MDGTNWTVADAKGIWRPTGPGGAHEVSYGYHFDTYVLNNPVYRTRELDGRTGRDRTSFTRSAEGKTETQALWAQDAWRFAPMWKLTLGGRWESWRAFDGLQSQHDHDGDRRHRRRHHRDHGGQPAGAQRHALLAQGGAELSSRTSCGSSPARSASPTASRP